VVERVEDGDAVRATDDRLAVDREWIGAQLGRRGGGRRMPGAPVVAAAREEAHRVAIAPNLDAVAIVRLISWTQSGPADGLAVRVGMQGGTKPVARDMPLYYRRR
jgi:hypothetical protein